MLYWRYKAYDEQLTVKEGIVTSKDNNQESLDRLILELRNQGLQIVSLSSTDRATYLQEKRLAILKKKLSSPVRTKSMPTKSVKLTIRQRLKFLLAAILGRNNT